MTDWFELNDEDERAVAAFMERVAALPIEHPNLECRTPNPEDASRLWWKSRLLKRWDAERRAQRPLDLMHPIEVAGGLVAAGLLLYWSLPILF